ncbi:hypothetical protein [Massilia sp. S19_KUP03_FR1]|uniref:hypothetical protein n=1 Tax=Massilia sp. S19_KUP03_FR1 TaxID=3025503 RepID=UPI002FCDBEF1
MSPLKTVLAFALPLLMLAVQAAPAASWVQLNSLDDLPAAVRASLAAATGLSDRGGPFNAGCVVQKDVPQSRFVLGARQPDVLVLAVEHGGFAHFVETLEYRQAGGLWTLARRGHGSVNVDSAQVLVAQHQESQKRATP